MMRLLVCFILSISFLYGATKGKYTFDDTSFGKELKKEVSFEEKYKSWKQTYFRLMKAAEKNSTPYFKPFHTLMLNMNQETRNLIIDFTNWYIKSKKPPTKFCLIALGSLATKCTSFFSDVEFGVLVENQTQKTLKYFAEYTTELNKFLKKQTSSLSVPMHVDAEDLAPLHFNDDKSDISDFANYDGSVFMVATPSIMSLYPLITVYDNGFDRYEKELLNTIEKQLKGNYDPSKQETFWEKAFVFYTSPLSLKGEHHTRQSLQNIARSLKNVDYLYGEESLFWEFKEEFSKKMNMSLGKNITLKQKYLENILFELNKFLGKNDIFLALEESCTVKSTEENPFLRIKYSLFRPFEQALLNLAFTHDIQFSGLEDIIKELGQKKVFPLIFSSQLQTILYYLSFLRLKEQFILDKPSFGICLNEDVCKLKKDEAFKFLQGLSPSKIAYEEEVQKAKGDLEILKELAKKFQWILWTFSEQQHIVDLYSKLSPNIIEKGVPLEKSKTKEEIINETDLFYIYNAVIPILCNCISLSRTYSQVMIKQPIQ